MSKSSMEKLTESSAIQDRIDSATKEESDRNQRLREEFKTISASATNETDVKIPPTLSFKLGNSRYEKTMSSSIDFNTLFDEVLDSGNRGKYIGYEDRSSRDIWLRNDRDLQSCFREHAAVKNFTVVFKTMRNSDLPDANFESEVTEGVTFKFAIDRKEDTLIFTSVPVGCSLADGLELLKSISKGKSSFKFIDSDGDTVTLASEIEWRYFLKDCETLAKKGQYCLVLSSNS